MSANNVIYMQRRGDNIFVWHQDIDSPIKPGGHDIKVFDNSTYGHWGEARDYAQHLMAQMGIVEYGIQILPDYEHLEPEQAQQGQFWMVWRPKGGKPWVRHESLASATAEAERIAVKEGDTVYVLWAVAEVEPVAVVRELGDGVST